MLWQQQLSASDLQCNGRLGLASIRLSLTDLAMLVDQRMQGAQVRRVVDLHFTLVLGYGAKLTAALSERACTLADAAGTYY